MEKTDFSKGGQGFARHKNLVAQGVYRAFPGLPLIAVNAQILGVVAKDQLPVVVLQLLRQFQCGRFIGLVGDDQQGLPSAGTGVGKDLAVPIVAELQIAVDDGLQLLEQLTDRQTVMQLLIKYVRFDTFPRGAKLHLRLRKQINKLIADNLP